MKYNRALDLLGVAVSAFHQGNPEKATRAFAAACKSPSIKEALAAIENTNAKAYASMVKAAKLEVARVEKARVRASAQQARVSATRKVLAEEESFDGMNETVFDEEDSVEESVASEDIQDFEEIQVEDVDASDDEDTTESFARILASLTRKASK